MISDAYVKAQKLAGTFNWESRQGQRDFARGHGPEQWARGAGSGGSSSISLHQPSVTSPSAADPFSAVSRLSLPPDPYHEWENIEEVPDLAELLPATAPGSLQQLANQYMSAGIVWGGVADRVLVVKIVPAIR
jgi:hypothetical protein